MSSRLYSFLLKYECNIQSVFVKRHYIRYRYNNKNNNISIASYDMRRKFEILKHLNNKNKLSQKQEYANATKRRRQTCSDTDVKIKLSASDVPRSKYITELYLDNNISLLNSINTVKKTYMGGGGKRIGKNILNDIDIIS